MAAEDVVVLVPGLFGFDRFGEKGLSTSISYFDQVANRLCTGAGLRDEQVLVHQPPPTGALAWRVKTLYDLLHDLHTGKKKPVSELRKIHLVGHSTGGSDLRLLLNDSFSWPAPPSASQRAEVKARIGQAISISAPHLGTPIARRLRGTMENALPFLYLFSIFGKLSIPPQSAREFAAILRNSVVDTLTADESKKFRDSLLKRLPTELVADVSRFIGNVNDDHALIHDLTPIAMARLNETIAGGDTFPIKSYVTVAPAPTARTFLQLMLPSHKVEQLIYSIGYLSTKPASTAFQQFPKGRWLGPVADELRTGFANDGVVPCACQIVPASTVPPTLIAGDHLDVVGHFESKRFRGTSVFLSGSSFDDDRFDALWFDVADQIAPPTRHGG